MVEIEGNKAKKEKLPSAPENCAKLEFRIAPANADGTHRRRKR